MEAKVEFPKVTTAPENSRFHVSNRFESLDYENLDSLVYIDEEEARGKSFMVGVIIQRVLVFFVLGMLVGITGAIIEIGVNYSTFLRFSLLYEATNSYLDSNFLKLCYFWTISMFVPSFVASVLVAYGEPLAVGGGAHFAFGYLNGVRIENLMRYKVVLIKTISLILTVMSGLPTGKEGPLLAMGCIIGSITPFMSFCKFSPFENFQLDAERRDMAAAGTAAGFTAAFGTPIAGIMIAFEENLSLWTAEMTFLIFISAIICCFTLKFIVNIILKGCYECFGSQQNLFMETMSKADKSFLLYEIPLYVLFGILGGLFGAVWNCLNDQISFLRKRIVDTPAKKLIEVIGIIILNGFFQSCCVKYLEDYCIEENGSKNLTESMYNPSVIKLKCQKENEYSASGLFFFQNTGGVFRSVFTENESHIGTLPLTIFCLYYYFGTCLLVGCQLCNGIFIPHILIGNIWGRIIAENLNILFPNSVPWARPNKFALLCGAAQICGTFRTTFTICVMMLESCNNVTLGIPIFIIVFVARFVGNSINLPLLIRNDSYLGIPLLDKEAPPLLTHIKVKDLISSAPKPLVTLTMKPTYRAIRESLNNNTHNGFPIVSNGSNSEEDKDSLHSNGVLKGLILRKKIKILIKYRHVFNNEMVESKKKAQLMRKELSSDIETKALKWKLEEDNTVLDLRPFMNPTPYFVHLECSLSHAYRTFSALGLRHLVVVNDQYQVVGMITRKDLSVFRLIRSGLRIEVRKLPLRD
ncbi:H(+)/Cl(-) exchange transporter 7 [Halyomorpha halys]|uniref:H(+)/Cl(-) exchange transporter 7 n=1 Tax=Halyomorpha halys TaxID=286706 RepID=UPI0006D4F1E4|nr:H(+)/Cl(-) exchange transporter 7-like [Halyomorpha halys]XP_014280459.1 H(+)/Cl(-) exchange transporter 7-like [Halyomorpha halys]